MGMPLPPGIPKAVTATSLKEESRSSVELAREKVERDGELSDGESNFILDTTLRAKHREDKSVLCFIESFVRCQNIQQACDESGIGYSVGYRYRHLKDIANAISKLISKSAMKYGFDGSEIVERTKEMVDFDPIMLQNADGSFKDNLADIEPAARRNLRKLEVHNLINTSKDLNGMSQKIIIGKVIKYEFYDKLKAIELVGREKDLFVTKSVQVHDVTKNMASILLESAKRGKATSLGYSGKEVVEVESESRTITEDE